MIHFGFSISNPWAKAKFEPIWTVTKPISKNKFMEFELYKLHTIFEFGFTLTHRTDHAGVSIDFGMLGLTASIGLFDHRHWNRVTNKWYEYEESA